MDFLRVAGGTAWRIALCAVPGDAAYLSGSGHGRLPSSGGRRSLEGGASSAAPGDAAYLRLEPFAGSACSSVVMYLFSGRPLPSRLS